MPHLALRVVVLFLLIAIAPACTPSQDAGRRPTYYADVRPILRASCVSCHRSAAPEFGGIVAPFSLESYRDAEPRARAIRDAVLSGHMPPWNAAPEFRGVFENERVLSASEIGTIASWVDGGAPAGKGTDSFHEGIDSVTLASTPEPDLLIPLPREIVLTDPSVDQYEYFSIVLTAELLRSDRWIRAIEFRAGSRSVHHASIIANGRLLGAVAPGYQRRDYPAGFGDLVRVGDTLSVEVHYHSNAKEGAVVRDRSQIALYFHRAGDLISHVVETETLGIWDFTIPAGDSSYTDSASYTFEKDYYLLWLTPHMHWRGKTVRFVADFPDGTRKELLRVPRYDFNWQHTYRFKHPVLAPKGTRVTVVLQWDNSSANRANPDPRVAVRYGPRSSDEMGVGLILITEAKARSIIVGAPVPADLPAPRPVMRDMKHTAAPER